jgi:GABA(A) receptor-associated protein
MSIVKYKPFNERKTFDERCVIYNKLSGDHPNHIPVICEPSSGCKIKLENNKYKYLCPENIPIGEFLHIIRKRMPKLDKGDAVFLLVNNISPCNSCELGQLYDQHKQEDGFLYIKYDNENTFG